MQTANCHVRLGGDMNNEIFKGCVTVAEIALLRAVHGNDAVVKVQATGNDKRPHAAEIDRLKDVYGAKVFETVFPGSYPQLPVNFKDIGIDAVELLAAPAPKAPKVAKDKGADDAGKSDAGKSDAADGAKD
jgi:hypothetical protein